MFKYFLYRPGTNKKTGLSGFEKVSSHASYSALQRAYEKKKVDDPKIFMVLLPVSLKVKDILYRENDTVYGEIVEETEHFYFIQRPPIIEPPPIRMTKPMRQEQIAKPVKKVKKKNATAASELDEQDERAVTYETVEVPRTFESDEERIAFLKRLNEPVPFVKASINDHFIKGFSGRGIGFIIPLGMRK